MKESVLLTEEAKKELEKELKMRKEMQKQIALELEEARAQGDITENSWHDAVLEKRDVNDKIIAEIEEIFKNSEIIKYDKGSKAVQLGSKIDVEIINIETDNHNLKTLELVAAVQADPLNGKISVESPLGRSLYNHVAGDEIEFNQPNGVSVKYIIQKIY